MDTTAGDAGRSGPEGGAANSRPMTTPTVAPRQFLGALGLAVLIGIPISLAALGFVWLVNLLTDWLWQDLPAALGVQPSAWWYLLLVPAVGGLLVAAARLLPGHASHGPLDGFARQTDPGALPAILLAALATLACGAVLGPEAPLLALGTGLGLLIARGRSLPVRQMSSAAGGFAAFSALLANPLVTAIFLLEATSASVSSIALVPGLAASGVGFLVFTGVGDWTGMEIPSFAISGLPAYDSVSAAQLAWAVPVAIVAAVGTLAAFVTGKRVAAAVRGRPLVVVVPLAGLVVGALASLFVALTGQAPDLVLFSGERQLPQLLAQTSAGTVVVILVLKALAYAVSLGSGFRGGPIFPALFLGTGIGLACGLVLPGLDTTPAVAVGVSAAAAATMRLPFAAAALSLLIVGSEGAATTVMTITGAVVGFLVGRAAMLALERRQATGSPGEPAAAAG